MKSIPPALAAHLAGEVVKLATCTRIARRDGAAVVRLTDHDADLTVEGETYRSRSGYSRAAIATDASLAVGETEVVGLLTDLDVAEADVRAGLWDHAAVRTFVVSCQ